jgi:hypothetical protein
MERRNDADNIALYNAPEHVRWGSHQIPVFRKDAYTCYICVSERVRESVSACEHARWGSHQIPVFHKDAYTCYICVCVCVCESVSACVRARWGSPDTSLSYRCIYVLHLCECLCVCERVCVCVCARWGSHEIPVFHGMDDRDMLSIRRLLTHALLALLHSSARELTNLTLPGMLDLTIIYS